MLTRHHHRLRRGALVATPIVLLAFFLVASRSTGDEPEASWSMIELVGVWSVLLGVVGFALVSLLILPDHDNDHIAAQLLRTGDGRELVARWLHRVSFYRNLGGLAGLILWVASWTNGLNTETILAFGTGGLVAGGIAAECRRFAPVETSNIASVEPRRIGTYLVARDERRAAGLAVVWLGIAVAGVVQGVGGAVLPLVAAALGILGIVRLTQRRVANRPRPNLEPELTRADDLVRELAITRGLAQPANAFAMTMLAPAFQLFSDDGGVWADTLSLIVWLTSVAWWAKNRRLGLDWLLDEPERFPEPRPMKEVAL